MNNKIIYSNITQTNGFVYSYDDNGDLLFSGGFKNNAAHGCHIKYYNNEIVFSKYKKGKENGIIFTLKNND